MAYAWFYSILILQSIRGINIEYLQLVIFPYSLLLYWHATRKIMPRILLDDNNTRKRKK